MHSRMANIERPPLLPFNRPAALHCERPKAPLFVSLALLAVSCAHDEENKLLSIFPNLRKARRSLETTGRLPGSPDYRQLSHLRLCVLGTLAAATISDQPAENERCLRSREVSGEQSRFEVVHHLPALQLSKETTQRSPIPPR